MPGGLRNASKPVFFLLVLRPPLRLPGFKCVQPGLEALAHSPEHAGEVRVVEGDHLRAVAPPRGPRQILPLRSCEVVRGEAQPQVPVHVRALVLLGLHGVEELQELRHVGLGNLRLHPAVRQVREARVADHVARVARDHEAAGVPLVRGQGQLRGEALRLHQRLVVDHDELALVRPAVPLQEDPRALAVRCRGPRCCWTLAACSSPPSSSSGRDRPRSLKCWSR